MWLRFLRSGTSPRPLTDQGATTSASNHEPIFSPDGRPGRASGTNLTFVVAHSGAAVFDLAFQVEPVARTRSRRTGHICRPVATRPTGPTRNSDSEKEPQ